LPEVCNEVDHRRYAMSSNEPSVTRASDLDPGVAHSQYDAKPVLRADDDVPARRLLAHDLEHIVWDDDGDERVPPPD
jgi:hypothetical protein